MVSTTDKFTYNSTMLPGPSVTFRNPSARKSLCLFTEFLDVKNKTDVSPVSAAESKCKAVREDIMLWSSIPKRRRYTKINEQVKISLYIGILQNPRVVQSPSANYCFKVSIDGPSEPQLVSTFLL